MENKPRFERKPGIWQYVKSQYETDLLIQMQSKNLDFQYREQLNFDTLEGYIKEQITKCDYSGELWEPGYKIVRYWITS